MSTISDVLSSPTLWAGAATGSLFSALVTGFFTRSTTRASDDRKAAAERARIELGQVRDAALNFLSVCDEIYAEVTSYSYGVIDPTKKYSGESGKTDFENALAYAMDTGTRISVAANRLILIAPSALADAVWPVQHGLTGMIPHPSDGESRRPSEGKIYRKNYDELINAIRISLDIAPVDYKRRAEILSRTRSAEFKQRKADEAEKAARESRNKSPEDDVHATENAN
ncbi:hypothetical protein [Tsukamurella paurometabola]|uniref:Uncharacterized protein n=1 Tax=Tsukamurella paurometabola TaxID=2061 RepID=A0ABS5NIT0_TSUPA|nr:hypothetical protein [Tsukamurella paurometabola]MBS4104173.1 hypothetical protein [Tsukamurella paurometabola]